MQFFRFSICLSSVPFAIFSFFFLCYPLSFWVTIEVLTGFPPRQLECTVNRTKEVVIDSPVVAENLCCRRGVHNSEVKAVG